MTDPSIQKKKELSLRRSRLSPEKQAMLAKRLASAQGEGTQPLDIPRWSERGPAPLSFAQQRLWFLDQLKPGNIAYSIPIALRLEGPLNYSALEKSLHAIVQRHESLRTIFFTHGGVPFQQVLAPQGVSIRSVNLQQECAADDLWRSYLQEQMLQEVHRPFDLTTGPLLRATLFQLEQQQRVLLLTIHHIAADGWSLGILFEELEILYQRFCMGDVPTLPELDIQYLDFAHWQRHSLQGEALNRLITYWKEQLQGAPALLELPVDRPRPAKQTYQGATQCFHVADTVTHALKKLSQQEGVTLFMTLLAVFQVQLFRYTGQEDLVIGTPVAGRTHSQLEPLIGFFVNTLALRARLQGMLPFRDLLRQVKQTALGAYAHQALPFERLVEELHLQRHSGYNPLFQVMFTLQSTPPQAPQLLALQVSSLPVYPQTAQFDLALELKEERGGLTGELEYNTDLFDQQTIKRMVGHFQCLLEGVLAEPDRVIGQLPLLTPAEQYQLLIEWNQTRREYPRDTCVHTLFEEQVMRNPEAHAVMWGEQCLTYRELNAKANQLARRLQTSGVGPDVLVGLCVERSLEMTVGLLGILKAGGAYIPLDPTYPPERLAFMLHDAAAPVLITQKKVQVDFSTYTGSIIYLDEAWEEIAQESTAPLISEVKATHLAYVIYTSGSTGRPKGVAIEHRSLVNHCCAVAQHYKLTPADRVLQFASLSFDVAAEEIYPTWTSGATLVLRPPYMTTSIIDGHQWLERVQISVLNLPVVYWNHWTTTLLEHSLSVPSCVRLVVVGSEEVLPDYYVQWRQCAEPQPQWINAYGPTECTITTILYDGASTSGDQQGRRTRIPIGRPIANTSLYVLDEHLQPVPVGVVGELYIGGVCLARGYLNRADLTADRFILNPHIRPNEERFYRTGDLVRYLPDGNLEYIGRIDQQVKIRGYRVELNEISSAIQLHPAVKECVILVREHHRDNRHLVAFLIGADPQVVSNRELRSFLQKWLPDYMVPTTFVWLKDFPLMPNGKVDHQKLLLLAPMLEKEETNVTAARNAIEEQLVNIWSDVLNVGLFGIYDNFFELGGHSLLAVRVMSRVRETFHVDLPLQSLFATPTIAELAVVVTQEIAANELIWDDEA